MDDEETKKILNRTFDITDDEEMDTEDTTSKNLNDCATALLIMKI